MTKMKILLSDEQLEAISTQLNNLIFAEIEKLEHKKICNIVIWIKNKRVIIYKFLIIHSTLGSKKDYHASKSMDQTDLTV